MTTGPTAASPGANIEAEFPPAATLAVGSVVGLPHGHVLLLEDDPATRNLLLDLFQDEEIDATLCGSLRELQSAVTTHPGAVVVSDSWSGTDNRAISHEQRAEIMALGTSAPVILTTGRSWGNNIRSDEFGSVIVLPKPYDLDELMALIRSAVASGSQVEEARAPSSH